MMNFRTIGFAAALAGLSAGSVFAQAQSTNRVAAETDWSVFVEDNPTECWGVSTPKESVNSRDGRVVAVNRGQTLLMVFYRPSAGAKGQVAFTGGYPFASGSTVNMNIGGTTFELFTEGEWAWPATTEDDNKIIAAMQPRESEFSAFVDSDVLFIRPNTIDNIVKSGHVSCSVAASMYWAQKDIWDLIYGAFDMEIPEERVYLMRQSRRPKVPYFSSGFVLFPEAEGPQGRFADVWYETARRIDEIDTLEKRRPYLDQMSLPVAIRRAGLTWNPLAEEQHYILGGKIRGEPLPEDRDIFTVHYRNPKVLEEVGLKHKSRRMLRRQTGVSFVRRLARTDEPTPE